MKKLVLAFQFLTIIPVKDIGETSEKEMGSVTAYFPLVGFIEGVLYGALSLMFLKVFPSELNSGLLVFAMILVNGGLHLDGLSDTFDAVASGGDRQKKLSIMKDSTIGPAGVIAIVLVILLKYLLLNVMYDYSSLSDYYAALILMPVLARCTMVWSIYYCSTAKDEGLGRIFIEHTGMRQVAISTGFTLLLCIMGIGYTAGLSQILFYLMFVIPILFGLSIMSVWFFRKHFNGMMGDSFGSVYEIAILLFLITRVIWSQQSI